MYQITEVKKEPLNLPLQFLASQPHLRSLERRLTFRKLQETKAHSWDEPTRLRPDSTAWKNRLFQRSKVITFERHRLFEKVRLFIVDYGERFQTWLP